jgi:hypothetical protein
MKEMYELRDKLCEELKKYSKKEMSSSTLDVVDKLAHALKNLDKVIDGEDYSEAYRMYDGARRRDAMGRYSSDYSRGYSRGYSYHDGTIDELRGIMEDAPEDIKGDLHRLIRKMESK